MKNLYDQLRHSHDSLLYEKKEFENRLKKSQDDENHYRSALLQENSSLVAESNKLKSENNRLIEDLEKKDRSVYDGASTKQRLHDQDKDIEEFKIEIHRLHQLMKKAEDEVGSVWSVSCIFLFIFQNKIFKTTLLEETNERTRVTTDFMKLDRQYIATQNENVLLKQRLASYESIDSELQQSRSQLQFFEHQLHDIQNENKQLKVKIQFLQDRFQSGSAISDHSQYDNNSVPRSSSQLYLPSPPPTALHQVKLSSFSTPFSSSSYSVYEDQPQTTVTERKFPKSLSTTLNDTYDNRESNNVSHLRRNESSLANVIDGFNPSSNSAASRRNMSSSGGVPFATDDTSFRLMKEFDQMERALTSLITEKNTLQEESERSILFFLFLFFTIYPDYISGV
jgi:regulator of replication initiation timing